METTVLTRDRKLETMAKAVFGKGMVEAAYVATWSYDCPEDEIRDRLGRASFTEVTKEIDQGAKTIVITFVSGNSVKFTNAEWGAMARVNLKAKDILILEGE